MNDEPNMNRILFYIATSLLIGWVTARAGELKPLVKFPAATDIASVIKIGEILGDRHIRGVEVLLDRSVHSGPVDLHAEIAKMLSLLASPQSASESPLNLALEDHGPTIRVTMTSGQELVVRRIHFDCYRIYWDGKTTWFRLAMSSNKGAAQPPR